MSEAPAPLKLFLSYAHEDEELADRLKAHLAGLVRSGLIDIWYDRRIQPGADWSAEIARELEQADLILFLLSADFLDSDYCSQVEARRALERHLEGSARVVPIFLRPVELAETPFRDIQGLPHDAKAVTEWANPDQACRQIAEGIYRMARRARRSEGGRWFSLGTQRRWPWIGLGLAVLVATGLVVWLPIFLIRKAEQAYVLEDWQHASDCVAWALRIRPSARANWVAGLVDQRYHGDLDRAEQRFRAALAADPEDPRYRLSLASLREVLGDDAEVVQLLESLVQDQPWLFAAYSHLTGALERQGRLPEALYFHRRLAELLVQDAPWQRAENLADWYFPTTLGRVELSTRGAKTGLNRVELTTRAAKTALARAEHSLDLFLVGQQVQAEELFRQAREGGVDPMIFERNVLALLGYRVWRLGQERLEWRERLDAYRGAFGVPLWPQL